MIEVWDPISLPSGFDFKRIGQLERQIGKFGVRIHARWSGRSDLVTSKIESLLAAPAHQAIPNYEQCTLELASGLSRDHYMHEIRKFADEVRRRATSGTVIYERVQDCSKRRVHLVRPFESVAICGKSAITLPNGRDDLTCKPCIRLALNHINRVPHPLESVELSIEEIENGRLIAMRTPRQKSSAPRETIASVVEAWCNTMFTVTGGS